MYWAPTNFQKNKLRIRAVALTEAVALAAGVAVALTEAVALAAGVAAAVELSLLIGTVELSPAGAVELSALVEPEISIEVVLEPSLVF